MPPLPPNQVSVPAVATVITRHWSPEFRKLYGGDVGDGSGLPLSYACVDLETSGFNREQDVILSYGHCVVRDGKVADRFECLLNWYDLPAAVPAAYLDQQLKRLEYELAVDGRTWRITPELLRAEGIHPHEAVQFMYDFLTALQARNELLVLHNGWNFDVQFLRNCFDQDLGVVWDLDPNCLLDTSAVVKASQLVQGNRQALPQAGETLKDYFNRINSWRAKGIYSNLDNFCVKEFNLAVDSAKSHTAGEDAYALHLLVEELRKRSLASQPVVRAPGLNASIKPAAARPVVAPRPAAPPPRPAPQPAVLPVFRKQRNR